MAIHFILQGKGGIGKSYVATVLTQFWMDRNIPVSGIDLDPTNPTFGEFESLPVERINLLNDAGQIDTQKFAVFSEKLLNYPNETEIIVDCGASAYIPTTQFLEQMQFIDWAKSFNKTVYIHTILKGGGELLDTMLSCSDLFERFQDCKFIIWLNESKQPVLFKEKSFVDGPFYKKNQKRILDVIPLPEYTSGFFKGDIDKMIEQRLTFKEAIEGDEFMLVPKRCLFLYRQSLWARLDLFMKNYNAYGDSDGTAEG